MSEANILWRMATYHEGPQTHEDRWTFDHAVLLDHVTNKTHYISTNTIPIDTKLGKVGLGPTLRSCNLKATWTSDHVVNVRSREKIEKSLSQLS